MNLRNSARGEMCTITEADICNGDPTTTVLAHHRQVGISGAGLKAPDLLAAYACSACHDFVDGRGDTQKCSREISDPRSYRELAHFRGIMRTQALWIERGWVHW